MPQKKRNGAKAQKPKRKPQRHQTSPNLEKQRYRAEQRRKRAIENAKANGEKRPKIEREKHSRFSKKELAVIIISVIVAVGMMLPSLANIFATDQQVTLTEEQQEEQYKQQIQSMKDALEKAQDTYDDVEKKIADEPGNVGLKYDLGEAAYNLAQMLPYKSTIRQAEAELEATESEDIEENADESTETTSETTNESDESTETTDGENTDATDSKNTEIDQETATENAVIAAEQAEANKRQNELLHQALTAYGTWLDAQSDKTSQKAQNVRLNMGYIKDTMSRHEDAIETFKSLAEECDNALAYYALASIYDEEGQTDEAIAAYQKAADIDEQNGFGVKNTSLERIEALQNPEDEESDGTESITLDELTSNEDAIQVVDSTGITEN